MTWLRPLQLTNRFLDPDWSRIRQDSGINASSFYFWLLRWWYQKKTQKKTRRQPKKQNIARIKCWVFSAKRLCRKNQQTRLTWNKPDLVEKINSSNTDCQSSTNNTHGTTGTPFHPEKRNRNGVPDSTVTKETWLPYRSSNLLAADQVLTSHLALNWL